MGVGGSGTLADAELIATGKKHGCAAVLSTINCWGFNDKGQLGDGTTNDSSTPVIVSGL